MELAEYSLVVYDKGVLVQFFSLWTHPPPHVQPVAIAMNCLRSSGLVGRDRQALMPMVALQACGNMRSPADCHRPIAARLNNDQVKKVPILLGPVIGLWSEAIRPVLQPLDRALMIRLDKAAILSTVFEGVLYGWSVLMFVLAMWILVHRRKRLNILAVSAACVLFLLSTAEMSVNILHVCEGFVGIGSTMSGGPVEYFSDVTRTSFVTKSWLYNIQTIVFDAVVIHRAYLAWQSVFVVVIPIIFWFGLIASTIGSNIALASAKATSGDLFAPATSHWIPAVYAMTLGTNLTATGLLAFRIWHVTRISADYRSTPLRSILSAVLESGAIYSATVVAALVTFVLKSNANYIILDLISPIICIVFHMIVLRIGLATEPSLRGTPGPTSASTRRSIAFAGPRPSTVRQPEDPYQMKSLAVELSQYLDSGEDEPTSSQNVHSDHGPGSKTTLPHAPV
ncbi:hypothetical protein EVG20_g9484 [Dentipellis fragilis]|uniref:Uncharacterized protein n=1 Tax=Dentipellis fragilis TaxID=205917 RepID=A0A4Y9XZ76_9AGAM|nr:hypothetical protein EVG20_g9484 [Dentipellis fragilis]